MSPSGSDRSRDEQEPVIITDKRKVGADRPSPGPVQGPEDGAAAPAPAEPDANAALLAERTADLQRLQAEYANYRKRAERERLAAGELAISRLLVDFLPVLDNIDRARAHGDLTGGLKAVADQLTAVFDKLGLVAFGEVGDAFDPAIHEAVLHDESDAVSVPTCTTVMRPGYTHGDRLLRAAMVGVTDPVHPIHPTPADTADQAVSDQEAADDQQDQQDQQNDEHDDNEPR